MRRPPQEPAWVQGPPDRRGGQHDHHRKDFLQGLAETVRQERGSSCPRDVCRAAPTHRCKHGRHPDRSVHAEHQTVAVVSWMWSLSQETALAAVSPVSMWHWPHPTRPVLGVSGGLSRSSRTLPLVCPVCHSLGRCGGAPAGSTRASSTTRECGAGLAPKHGYSSCQSASAQKSERSHTRAAVPLQEGKRRSVEAPLRTPRALAGGGFRTRHLDEMTNFVESARRRSAKVELCLLDQPLRSRKST